MWNRAGLKANAKQTLRNCYWRGLVVCLIPIVLNHVFSIIISFVVNFTSSVSMITTAVITEDELSMVISTLLTTIFIFICILLIYAIFISNPLEVGTIRFFMCTRDRYTSIEEIAYAFKNGNYLNVVKIQFFRYLFLCLWCLLFCIPGIIKNYEYRMIPYIVAENPDIDRKRAFEISKEMMRGEKFNTFVLELSFLGWYLLGALACCIGVIFVMPYMQATYAELYGCLREKVLANGCTNSYELRGFDEV